MPQANKVKSQTDGVLYHVFDAMSIEDWDAQKSTRQYAARDEIADNIVQKCLDVDDDTPIKHVPATKCDNYGQILAQYVKNLDEGFEGVVIKDPKSLYQFERGSAMIKFKPTTTYEGSVIGWFKGTSGGKRTEAFAGFWVLLPNGVATRCGTGFSDVDKRNFHATITSKGIGHYLGSIAEVMGQPPITRDGKVRFPRFKRWRVASDVDPTIMKAYDAWVAAGKVAPPIDR